MASFGLTLSGLGLSGNPPSSPTDSISSPTGTVPTSALILECSVAKTINEIILLNDNLTGCLPPEIGFLNKLTVFDVSFNHLQGPLPSTVGHMRSLEQLDVAHNSLTGLIPATVCQLPRLHNKWVPIFLLLQPTMSNNIFFFLVIQNQASQLSAPGTYHHH
ncbi:Leucine-rich repeat extensin-like protein 2 [Camellia lanceoleosa]|uniref:Leucine-rich repeat extensin-like protein 2 n=1 Tax=Camellia lanceoleosa TaxID=1840588 RepID=A0ACC0IRY2_9ERIC|nr:Leucine-rich repeat extensin-like protein 2 [Camellia lanceoleosa]